jgi:hypothetical protein
MKRNLPLTITSLLSVSRSVGYWVSEGRMMRRPSWASAITRHMRKAVSSVTRRYKVLLDGRLIGTVHLAGPALRVERARLGATPAYKRLARLRRRVDDASAEYRNQGLATSEHVLADEEAALRDLSNLPLTLVEDDGVTSTVATIRFVATSPPTLRVEW